MKEFSACAGLDVHKNQTGLGNYAIQNSHNRAQTEPGCQGGKLLGGNRVRSRHGVSAQHKGGVVQPVENAVGDAQNE